jgi:AcrR family transcriptional regulator
MPQILDVALEEFARNRLKATRIEDIANRAQLSKSGFYAHFGGKKDLPIVNLQP